MRIAYFDCSSGVSGDMILSAFIDAGLPVSCLKRELKKLKISIRGGSAFGGKNWELKIKNVERKKLPAKQVIINGEVKFSSPEEMTRIIKESRLKKKIKEQALHIFSSLINAERKVHKVSKTSPLHLDELANLDTLIDIVGACVAIERFKLERLYASPINTGSPAPAAIKLLEGLPIYSEGKGEELTTPTGAAILTSLVNEFGKMPLMKVEKAGFGAGVKDISDKPNLLRLLIGKKDEDYEEDQVVLMETNIDDMNPQVYPYVMEKLFKNGAFDVWLTPVQMKKGRPGIILSCLLPDKKKKDISDLIFRETTTLGVRFIPWERIKLPRHIEKESTDLTYKVAEGKNFLKKKIEYKQAEKLSRKKDIPLKKILL